MPESKSSPRRIKARERQRQALELRKKGYTFEAIANKLGYAGKQGPEKAVAAALQRITQKPAEELKKLDLERLDFYLFSLRGKITKGQTLAIQTALAILARRAKLLGLDMPLKLEGEMEHKFKELPDLSNVPDSELDAALAEVERMLGKKG